MARSDFYYLRMLAFNDPNEYDKIERDRKHQRMVTMQKSKHTRRVLNEHQKKRNFVITKLAEVAARRAFIEVMGAKAMKNRAAMRRGAKFEVRWRRPGMVGVEPNASVSNDRASLVGLTYVRPPKKET